jgi:DNA-binding IclR family transcriptional regulator
VIVKGLSDLGYLHFNGRRKTYFPTEKLLYLGNWVQGSIFEASGLNDLISGIALEINETTALTSRNFIFCNFLRVQMGSQPISLQIPVGPGLTLINSVTGRVLLSQMRDQEFSRIFHYTQYWAPNAKAPAVSARAEVERDVASVRKNGYLTGYDIWQKGVGTVAYPIRWPAINSVLAVSVSGPANRIKHNEKSIRKAIERAIAFHRSISESATA